MLWTHEEVHGRDLRLEHDGGVLEVRDGRDELNVLVPVQELHHFLHLCQINSAPSFSRDKHAGWNSLAGC